MRVIIQILLFALPWRLRRPLLVSLLNFKLDPSSRIGFSLVLARHVDLREGARIGHLTLIRGIDAIQLCAFSILGNLNWVTGFPKGPSRHFRVEIDREPSLFIGRHSAITHRHLIDCTERVTIGDFTTFAGWGSQILTHAIDLKEGRQSSSPVKIGSYCFVGTRVVLLKGSVLPDYSILAAGSVLAKPMSDGATLYGGVPAVALRAVDVSGLYFRRSEGAVE